MDEKRSDGRGTFFSLSRRGLWVGIAGVAIAAAGLVTASGLASGAGLWHGHGRHHGRGWSAEEHARHAKLAAEWALRWVDATPEQQTRVASILDAQMPALEELADRHHESRTAFLAALTAETVDRAALETVRAGELALAEEASARLVAALADVAETLTPDQRAELARLAARLHD